MLEREALLGKGSWAQLRKGVIEKPFFDLDAQTGLGET